MLQQQKQKHVKLPVDRNEEGKHSFTVLFIINAWRIHTMVTVICSCVCDINLLAAQKVCIGN